MAKPSHEMFFYPFPGASRHKGSRHPLFTNIPPMSYIKPSNTVFKTKSGPISVILTVKTFDLSDLGIA